jgi:hypothetical protein
MFKIVIMRCVRSMGLGCAIMRRGFAYRAFSRVSTPPKAYKQDLWNV